MKNVQKSLFGNTDKIACFRRIFVVSFVFAKSKFKTLTTEKNNDKVKLVTKKKSLCQ